MVNRASTNLDSVFLVGRGADSVLYDRADDIFLDQYYPYYALYHRKRHALILTMPLDLITPCFSYMEHKL